MRNARFGLILTLVVALLATGCGIVEVDTGEGGDYPNQEISFIIPFEAGSAPDSTFRKLSGIAEQELGQSIVILNRPGGGGTVGVSEIISANPDGYTIGMSPVATLTIQPELQSTSFEGPSDLQPIIQTNAAPMVLFVSTNSGIQTIDDFVEQAKANPGGISVGMGGGEHTIIHLEVELLQREADIEVQELPYGAGEQVLAVVNGTIDAAVSQPAAMIQYVERGDLRILGIFGEEKPEGLDTPLFTEAGYDITEIPYEFVVAPKDTPAEQVQIIHDAYKAAMESEEFQDYVSENKVIAQYAGTEELQQKLESDDQLYESYIEEFGWKQS